MTQHTAPEATGHRPTKAERRLHAAEVRAQAQAQDRRRRRNTWILWGVGLVVAAAVIGLALYSARPTQTAAARPAPGFTLTDTTGRQVSLADYKGKNVILYFSEGAGCQSCITQMKQIEQQQDALDQGNFVVLPIVMNSRDAILPDLQREGVTTPFLLDDGTVSTEYGTIGKGMHAGLPGHSFVVIDATGMQRWYGEYPSMWLDPTELLTQATTAIAS